MAYIMGVQLVNGTDLIGSITGLNDDSAHAISIEDPAQVAMMPSQGGASNSMSIGLLPWIPYSEESKFIIQKDKIVTSFTPSVDLINNYNRIFGSGIQITSSLAR
jgi:hypothetical protein